jgi:O-antigen/teichoic acid export membrane protein
MEGVKSGLTAKVGSGTFWSALARVSVQVVSFISAAVVARKLGPDAYGVMNMAQIAIGLLTLFREVGIGSAVVQRREINQEFLSSLFWMNMVLGCVATLICLGSAPFFATFFKQPQVASLLQFLALGFLLTSTTTIHVGLLMRKMSFRGLAIIEILSAVLSLAVAVTFAYSGAGVWSLVASTLAYSTTTTLGTLLIAKWWPAMYFAWKDIRSIMSFSAGLSGFNLVNYFARNADNILIGKYLGTRPLGFYQFAYMVMLYPLQNVSQLLGRVLFPAFAEIQTDHARFRQAYLRSSCVIAFVSFPMMAGVAAVAEPFVKVWLGSKWLPVVLLIQVLAPVGMLQSLGTTTGQIYTAKGRTDMLFVWGLAVSPVIVGGFYVGLHWGINGVAIAYAIVMALLAYPLFRIPFGLIGLPMRRFVQALAPYLVAAGIMFSAVFLISRSMESHGVRPLVTLLVTVPTGVILYLVAAVMLRLSVLAELEKILGPRFVMSGLFKSGRHP